MRHKSFALSPWLGNSSMRWCRYKTVEGEWPNQRPTVSEHYRSGEIYLVVTEWLWANGAFWPEKECLRNGEHSVLIDDPLCFVCNPPIYLHVCKVDDKLKMRVLLRDVEGEPYTFWDQEAEERIVIDEWGLRNMGNGEIRLQPKQNRRSKTKPKPDDGQQHFKFD